MNSNKCTVLLTPSEIALLIESTRVTEYHLAGEIPKLQSNRAEMLRINKLINDLAEVRSSLKQQI